MKCIWLGQAGLLFDFDGVKVMVDPYLSNSVAAVNPLNERRVEVDESFFDIKPDILILTHDHLDHTDPETLQVILSKYSGICVLAAPNAWKHVRTYGKDHNYVMFARDTEWTYGKIRFEAVHAQHSDECAVGVLITYENKNYFVTGDTLYHHKVIEDVKASKKVIDAVFLPVNGVGNNMNMTDAARFAKAIEAKKVVPVHFGLFDALNPEEDFVCENKIVHQIYQEVKL